jgi:photosystem II stability/assembly factor-like uncharacterized protein
VQPFGKLRQRTLVGAAVASALWIGLLPTGANAAVWTPLGPFGGTVHAVAVDPTDPAVVYVGTRTGVWKSVDAGATWTARSEGLNDFWISSLAIDPSDSQTLYAASHSGTHKSVDGGTTWTTLTELRGDLVVAPSDPQIVYSGGNRSTDGGVTWTTILDVQVGPIAVDPTNADVVYASTPSALKKSTDGGTTWSTLDVAEPFVGDIAIDPSAPETIFLAAGPITRSVDGGNTWETLPTPEGMLLYWIALSPSLPQTMYAAGHSGRLSAMARSDDGGDTWVVLQRPPGGVLPPVAAVDPVDPATVYVGTFGYGVWKTTDGGSSLVEANEGLAAEPAWDVAFDHANSNVAYVTFNTGGGFRTEDAGVTWERIENELLAEDRLVSIQAFAVDGGSSVYASRASDPSLPPVLRSDDGGRHWVVRSSGLPPNSWGRELYADPRASGIVFAATQDPGSWPWTGGLYKTIDGGENWTNISPSTAAIAAMAFDPDTNTIAIVAGLHDDFLDDGFFVSTDWGATWETRDYPDYPISSLAFGSTPLTIYAGSYSSSDVLKSVDGGETWTASHLDPTNYAGWIPAVAVDPADSSVVFAATHGGGIWWSGDGGDSWSAVTPGLRSLYVYTIEFAPSAPEPVTTAARALGEATAATADAPPAYTGLIGQGRGGLWRFLPPPHNQRRPPLWGRPRPGRSLTCGKGRWSRATTFRFRWVKNGRLLARPATRYYLVRNRDVGSRIRCRVTAYGAGGHRRAYSPVLTIRR